MFRVATFLIAIVSVAAFAPAARVRSVTMMAEKSPSLPFLPAPKNLEGFAGYKGFDPLGFATIIDPKYLAEAEIKHCRVSMLGVLGFIASQFVKLPGDVHQVSAVAAHDVAVKSGALSQVFIFVAVAEFLNIIAIKEMLEGSGRAPGEFGFDPLGFTNKKTAAQKMDLEAKEIENGRLAMLAFSGVVTQAVLTGKEFPFY